jgi:hypothetical protein
MKKSSHHNFIDGRDLESIRKAHEIKERTSSGVSTPRIRGTSVPWLSGVPEAIFDRLIKAGYV